MSIFPFRHQNLRVARDVFQGSGKFQKNEGLFAACALCPERHISNRSGIKIYNHLWSPYQGFPGGSAGKTIHLQSRRPQFNSWLGKILWRRGRLPTPVFLGLPGGSEGKESACNAGHLGSSLGWEDHPEEGMATHSSILAWRTPWTEEPGGPRTVHRVARSWT